MLLVTGKAQKGEEKKNGSYLHRGIARRAFERRFSLADHMKVTSANIDNGMPASEAARIILDGIAAGQREIPVAQGGELAILNLRASDPERAFAATAALGASLAAARDGA